MYDTETLRGDAESKATAQATTELTDRHINTWRRGRGSWQDLAGQAAALSMRFDGLPEKQAEVLRRKLAGQTCAEIAADLGITKTCAKRRLKRARQTLTG